jgi:FKBP-type peptidyl-prolyl cis-trans isomerase FkpA
VEIDPMRGVVMLSLVLILMSACNPTPTAPPAIQVPAQKFESKDITVGTGNAIASGQTAVVHYTGWLFDPSASDHRGKKFDSSRDRGQPFRFPLGGGQVIKGWDEGVAGMQVGGHRELTIPPDKGYGAAGAGDSIPPNSTLLFEVELLAIE